MVQYYFFMIPFFIFFSLNSTDHFTFQELISLDKEAVKITDYYEFPNCFITYVTIHRKPYVLKQKKRPKKGMSAVCDMLAAWIGKDLKIVHSAQIISAEQDFPGKKKGWPALLLTIAPGKTIRNQPKSKYFELDLKQKKDDDIFAHDSWLTEKMIHQITWHNQLPILVALDLFIGNTGRHTANLFYDPKQDIFCGIDMDHCYSINLSSIAIARFNFMILNKKTFTQKEIKALRIMKNTLEFLVEHHSPKKIIEQLDLLVNQGGMANAIAGIRNNLSATKTVIEESYASSVNLISLLDKIIRTFYRKGQNDHVD